MNKTDKGFIDIGKYAWESAGWYWTLGKKENSNILADKKDWEAISNLINENDSNTFKYRNANINKFYKIFTGKNLGLPEDLH